MDASVFAKLIEQVGWPLGLLLFIMWSGAREDWVFGRTYRRALGDLETAQKDRDAWQDLALSGTDLAERLEQIRRAG